MIPTHAVEDALTCHGEPEIFNTDQGGQFTSAAFTGVLSKNTSQKSILKMMIKLFHVRCLCAQRAEPTGTSSPASGLFFSGVDQNILNSFR